MTYMFQNCQQLLTLDLSNFITFNLVGMGQMFYNCINLQALNVNGFNTLNVDNMYAMFYNCKNLIELNLSDFNVRNVSNMNVMFGSCNNLNRIYTSNQFIIKNGCSASNIFVGCISLIGGNGTTYDSEHIDAEYARIDGKNGLPGYFTDIKDKTV